MAHQSDVTSKENHIKELLKFMKGGKYAHPWNSNSPLRMPFRVLSFSHENDPLTIESLEVRASGNIHG